MARELYCKNGINIVSLLPLLPASLIIGYTLQAPKHNLFFFLFKVCCPTTNRNFQRAMSQRGPSPSLTGDVSMCVCLGSTSLSICLQYLSPGNWSVWFVLFSTSAFHCTDTWRGGPSTQWNPSTSADWSGVRNAWLSDTQRSGTMCVMVSSPYIQNTEGWWPD